MKGDSYEDPVEKNWGWFDEEIVRGKCKGWVPDLGSDGSIPSKVKEKYRGVKFTYYRIRENGDNYAVGDHVMIRESSSLDTRQGKLTVFLPPPNDPQRGASL